MLYRFIIKTFSTVFYIGYLPYIPGTFASIFGVLLYYLVKDNPTTHILLTLSLIIISLCLGARAEKIFQTKDARYIVIDEVAGMLLALLFLPHDFIVVILAFFIFRILDAVKPYPAYELQNLRGGLGIITDDIIAGLYTNLILQAALRLASFRIS